MCDATTGTRDMVSVIIPSYNRFKYLLKAIESVKQQTYKNVEIIVINDCSSQPEYHTFDFEGCTVIHLGQPSRKILGHVSPGGYQRTQGMKISRGEYIAFLDDDDYWLPTKLEKQINKMKTDKCLIGCTDAYFGSGMYDPTRKYVIYNKEKYKGTIKGIFARKNKSKLFEDGFPTLWSKDFVNTHNCSVASSVVIHKSIIDKIGYFSNGLWAPDYDYWKRAIEHTDMSYVDEPLVYWDSKHGDGQNY